MARYLAYKASGAVSLADSEDPRPHYRLVREEDIKMGIVVPSSDPLIDHEAAFEIEADSLREAEARLAERVEEGFFF